MSNFQRLTDREIQLVPVIEEFTLPDGRERDNSMASTEQEKLTILGSWMRSTIDHLMEVNSTVSREHRA